MSDPLDYFAAPGVREARKAVEANAASQILLAFPEETNAIQLAQFIFERLQYLNAPVTSELIVKGYSCLVKCHDLIAQNQIVAATNQFRVFFGGTRPAALAALGLK